MTRSELLLKAASILKERGKVNGVCIHPRTGQVDLWGALCLAGGARPENLLDDIAKIDEYVPQAQIGVVLSAFHLVSEFVGEDPVEWADSVSSDILVQFLKDLGYHSQFAL